MVIEKSDTNCADQKVFYICLQPVGDKAIFDATKVVDSKKALLAIAKAMVRLFGTLNDCIPLTQYFPFVTEAGKNLVVIGKKGAVKKSYDCRDDNVIAKIEGVIPAVHPIYISSPIIILSQYRDGAYDGLTQDQTEMIHALFDNLSRTRFRTASGFVRTIPVVELNDYGRK